MSKRVFIAEKPSVAREFANSLGLSFKSRDGYMEAEDTIVTCFAIQKLLTVYLKSFWKKKKTSQIIRICIH